MTTCSWPEVPFQGHLRPRWSICWSQALLRPMQEHVARCYLAGEQDPESWEACRLMPRKVLYRVCHF